MLAHYRIGVYDLEHGEILCDECYEQRLQDEITYDMPKEAATKALNTYENEPMYEHLEFVSKYYEVAPFYEQDASAQGEYCAQCGVLFYDPICAECLETPSRENYPMVETPKYFWICQACAKKKGEKDHTTALYEHAQKLTLEALTHNDQRNFKEAKETIDRADDILELLEKVKVLELAEHALGIRELNEVTTDQIPL